MSLDSGFDINRQNHALIDQIQVAAWHGKEDLLNAPTLQLFSIDSLSDKDVVSVPIIGGNRIAMPSKATGRLSFDTMNLLTGILAGDYVGDENETVNIYYPHMRDGKLKGKTVMEMSLSDAALLLQKTADAHKIAVDLLKHAVTGMGTRFTMFQEDQFKLHSRDISHALIQIL